MLVLPGKSTFLGLITFCATDFMWDNGGAALTDNWGVPVLLGLHEEQCPVGMMYLGTSTAEPTGASPCCLVMSPRLVSPGWP